MCPIGFIATSDCLPHKDTTCIPCDESSAPERHSPRYEIQCVGKSDTDIPADSPLLGIGTGDDTNGLTLTEEGSGDETDLHPETPDVLLPTIDVVPTSFADNDTDVEGSGAEVNLSISNEADDSLESTTQLPVQSSTVVIQRSTTENLTIEFVSEEFIPLTSEPTPHVKPSTTSVPHDTATLKTEPEATPEPEISYTYSPIAEPETSPTPEPELEITTVGDLIINVGDGGILLNSNHNENGGGYSTVDPDVYLSGDLTHKNKKRKGMFDHR